MSIPPNTALGLSEEIPSATQRVDRWLRVAEYGDWPHPHGLQRLTHDAAAELVRDFRSLRGRLARRFGGLPVYIGHPDDKNFAGQSGHRDTRAYAWIHDLEAREDGLYILPRWSPAGQDLLRNAFYKHLSPRWAMRPLGDKSFQPVRLLSVGLTNHPNIPGEVIANQEKAATPANPVPAEAALANERQARIALLLDNAALTGVIAPNERERWAAGLEADFERGLAELRARRPALKTVAQTEDLGTRHVPGADFLTLVNERVERTGEAFTQAWSALKHERPDAFHEFNAF